MTSSMVSPKFNIFPAATEFYTKEECGTLKLGASQFRELLATVCTELAILYKSSLSSNETPSKVFAEHVLSELTIFEFDKLCVKCDTLQQYDEAEFGYFLKSELGKLCHRKKGEFDPTFDIHFSDMEASLDDTKLFTLIKALRLYLSELFRRIAGTYDPTDFKPENATYSHKGSKRATPEFISYAMDLHSLHLDFCKFSDNLSEFGKIFKNASVLSKTLSEKLKTQKEERRRAKTTSKDVKVVVTTTATATQAKPKTVHFSKQNDARNNEVKVVPNVWAKRKEQQVAKLDEARKLDEPTTLPESTTPAEIPHGTYTGVSMDDNGDFKLVSRKKNAKTIPTASTKGRRFQKE